MSERELLEQWRREKEDAAAAKLREGLRAAKGLLRIERAIKAELLAALEKIVDLRVTCQNTPAEAKAIMEAIAVIKKAKEIGGEPCPPSQLKPSRS
jgi:hypothetical protein